MPDRGAVELRLTAPSGSFAAAGIAQEVQGAGLPDTLDTAPRLADATVPAVQDRQGLVPGLQGLVPRADRLLQSLDVAGGSLNAATVALLEDSLEIQPILAP